MEEFIQSHAVKILLGGLFSVPTILLWLQWRINSIDKKVIDLLKKQSELMKIEVAKQVKIDHFIDDYKEDRKKISSILENHIKLNSAEHKELENEIRKVYEK